MNNCGKESAWDAIFEQCDVVSKVEQFGFFDLSAETIKKISQKEPRNMTKWDSRKSVPDVFCKNHLGLISISRKEYRIAPFEVFHKIEPKALKSVKIQSRQVPRWMLSLGDELRERSESGLLSACYASGIMSEYANVSQEEILPGIFGRLSTDKMMFTLKGIGLAKGRRVSIECNGVQFEIDACYESPDSLLLVEAKNCLLEDFNLRQLYFPWRYLHGAIRKNNVPKTIRPLFIMRSNEVVSVLEYKFMKESEMDSIELVSVNRYSFADEEITMDDLRNLLVAIGQTKLADTKTFPQANHMELVIDLCERLYNSPADTDDIAELLNYVRRQGQYYTQAAHFLGLVEKHAHAEYSLTKTGIKIFGYPYKKRQLEIAKCFLQYRVFSRCLEFAITNLILPNTSQVSKWIIDDGWPINGTTPGRRASTVIGWIRWLINLTNGN